MSTAPTHEDVSVEHDRATPPSAPVEVVEVHRRAGVAAGLGGVSAVVAIAYLQRAVESGSVLDSVLAVVLALLAAYWLRSFFDARVPLLVADTQGVRVRLGRTWRGLPWSAVHHVEHTPRPRGVWRDGRLVVVAHNQDLVLAELDGRALRQARISTRLYGAPLALPLGLSTRVSGAQGDLSAALSAFGSRTDVVVIEHSTDQPADEPADLVADEHEDLSAGERSLPAEDDRDVDPDHVEAEDSADAAEAAAARDLASSATPEPTRPLNLSRRVDSVALPVDVVAPPSPREDLTGRELNVPGRVTLVQESRLEPSVSIGEVIEPLVIDDFVAEPAPDPVIGPQIAAARSRLGLTVEALADRTRIRPHVIEAIEVDDFTPCGGDFYAKGHLRTLARVLGLDSEPLVESYQERYAHAPINPRRVFEADLAGGARGSLRSSLGGPNWSLLVAVVMAIVLAWSVASLVMDKPAPLSDTPVLNGSAGPNGSAGNSATSVPVPVTVTAAGGGARVVVRDREGAVVFRGNLARGESKKLEVAAPLRVQSSDGATTVAVGDKKAVALGESGASAQRSFVSR